MRIGIDAHMIGDHSGGNDSYYSGVLGAFEPDERNEYILFVKPGVDISAFKDRFTIVQFKSKGAFARNFIELTLLCIKYKLDLLHTQYYLPFIRPCQTVVTIHDICFEHFDDIFRKGEYIRNKLLIPYAARKADKIVTVSEFSKNDIADTYKVAKDKIVNTYFAVDKSFRKLSSDERKARDVRKKFDIGDGPYIICVGNLQPRKNITRLIEAYISYKKKAEAGEVEGPGAKLVIVGKKAWLYEKILEAAANESDIIFTDYVSREDLVALLNEAQGFVYPSIFEGFGVPPLEAINCGTAVAVSDIPVTRELFNDDLIFFDPYNVSDIERAIIDLLKIDKATCDLRDKYSKKFTMKSSAAILKKVYASFEHEKGR